MGAGRAEALLPHSGEWSPGAPPLRRGQPPVKLITVPSCAATTALPYPHRDRATASLRAALRLQAGLGDRLDWSTLTVTGPQVTRDARGREWFTYHAEVGTAEHAHADEAARADRHGQED